MPEKGTFIPEPISAKIMHNKLHEKLLDGKKARIAQVGRLPPCSLSADKRCGRRIGGRRHVARIGGDQHANGKNWYRAQGVEHRPTVKMRAEFRSVCQRVQVKHIIMLAMSGRRIRRQPSAG